ncbi:MAG: DUF488 family protein [Terriglobia bacterium]
MIRLKRAYEMPSQADGERILVERLWPRGLSKERANIDLWLNEVAPSPKLRQWFGHDPIRWSAFRRRYEAELRSGEDQIKLLKRKANAGAITLIYSARDEEHNSAVVLKHFLEKE